MPRPTSAVKPGTAPNLLMVKPAVPQQFGQVLRGAVLLHAGFGVVVQVCPYFLKTTTARLFAGHRLISHSLTDSSARTSRSTSMPRPGSLCDVHFGQDVLEVPGFLGEFHGAGELGGDDVGVAEGEMVSGGGGDAGFQHGADLDFQASEFSLGGQAVTGGDAAALHEFEVHHVH